MITKNNFFIKSFPFDRIKVENKNSRQITKKIVPIIKVLFTSKEFELHEEPLNKELDVE